MRPFVFTRLYRRIVLKYFGSTKNFLFWTIAIAVTIYLFDRYMSSSSSSSTLDARAAEAVVTKKIEGEVVKDEKQKQTEDPKKSKSCNGKPECPAGQYSYFIKSGLDSEGQPTICFNGNTLFSVEKANGGRGLNVLIVDETTGLVTEKRTFDTYSDDKILRRFLELGLVNNPIILIASWDEASSRLSDESRTLLETFGSQTIRKLGWRDNFVMIGQRGLSAPAYAVEKHNVKTESQSYAAEAEISGCISIPMGSVKKFQSSGNITAGAAAEQPGAAAPAEGPAEQGDLQFGANELNCGMDDKCPDDSVPVMIYTGKQNNDPPQFCYNGKLITSNADKSQTLGRGINALLIDPIKKRPVKFARFDTYESEKGAQDLVAYVKALEPHQISLFVAHDEAKSQLSEAAVSALDSIGSSYISGLSFRDVWIFAGQKNVKASGFEEIEFGDDQWPIPIKKRFCLPKTVPSLPKKQDVDAKKNTPNRVFCRKYDGYEELCSQENIDKVVTPEPMSDTSMKDNPIFNVPIVVVPGLGHISTYKQIKALFAIPGIDITKISVMFDMKFQESGALADRFGIPKVELSSSTKYVYLLEKALEEAWKKYPKEKYIILLEEEVIPTKDFLHFLAQCLPILDKDSSLVGASAFNENGYLQTSGQGDLIYRGRMMPGLGLLLKKSFYLESMQGKLSTCCVKRSWFGWFGDGGSDLGNKEMLYPDMSRVERLPFVGLTENPELIKAYFTKPRAFSSGVMTKLSNAESVVSADAYKAALVKLINDGVKVDAGLSCSALKNFTFIPAGTNSKTYVISSKQATSDDEEAMSQLAGCLDLFTAPGYKLRGVHHSILRFTHEGNTILIVGSQSNMLALQV